MKNRIAGICVAVAAFLPLAHGSRAVAADVKVLAAEAFKPAMEDIVRGFESASGHKVTAVFATAGVIRNRIRDGEWADVLITPSSVFASLMAEGRIVAGSETKIAQSLMAIAVQAGAPKPDIGTVEALKRALLAARSLAYSDPAEGGAIGVHAARVIERLGLSEQLRSKTVVTPAGQFRELVANGQAELAFVMPMVIITDPRIELVGPLPAELQNPADFAFMAGIGQNAKDVATGRALVQYLVSVPAARIIKAKGMEPH
jgi:molybdate transport system substrate-binding protein